MEGLGDLYHGVREIGRFWVALGMTMSMRALAACATSMTRTSALVTSAIDGLVGRPNAKDPTGFEIQGRNGS